MKRFCTLAVTITDLLLHRLFKNVTSKNKIAGRILLISRAGLAFLTVWLSQILLSRRRLSTPVKAVVILFF